MDEHVDERPCAICMTFRGGLQCVACLFFIMLLYKAWDVIRGKRNSVIADSSEESEKKNDKFLRLSLWGRGNWNEFYALYPRD